MGTYHDHLLDVPWRAPGSAGLAHVKWPARKSCSRLSPTLDTALVRWLRGSLRQDRSLRAPLVVSRCTS